MLPCRSSKEAEISVDNHRVARPCLLIARLHLSRKRRQLAAFRLGRYARTMTTIRLLIPLFASLGLISGPLPAAAVVGASASGEPQAGSVVMVLQRKGSAAGFCSGIVIGRTSVLTAAHCVPQGADVRIHFREAEGAPVLIPATRILRHPGYRADAIEKRERSIDLAVVTVAQPLPDRFSAAIIGDPGAVTAGTMFRFVGFGVTREGDGKSSGQLREATLAARKPLSAVLLWAEDPHHQGLGACTGDSGGPVFETSGDTIVALTLWATGSGAAQCGAVTQALWLAPYRDWIRDAAVFR